jgi:protein archease
VYRWIEHTAEFELEIDAPTREGVFEDALTAFAEMTRREKDKGEPVKQVVVVEAAEPETLLAEWLSELVYLIERADFVPERIEELVLRPTSLWACVRGRRGHPVPRVKAVSYDGLELRREADGWHARIALGS